MSDAVSKPSARSGRGSESTTSTCFAASPSDSLAWAAELSVPLSFELT